MPNSAKLPSEGFAPDLSLAELKSEIVDLRREVSLLRIANAELQRVVVRDTLTPLYNRRYFLTGVNERINRVKREGLTAAVIFVDVDDLKIINDRHGHVAGDMVLMHVAQLLTLALGRSDIAARIGGDEFALILENVDDAAAEAVAERLSQEISETPCEYEDSELFVHASFGTTSIRADDSDHALMSRADTIMYANKRYRKQGSLRA